MVKTPRTRHSKSSREPVTIDLEADKSEAVESEKADAPVTDDPVDRSADIDSAGDAEGADDTQPEASGDGERDGRESEPSTPIRRSTSITALLGAGIVGGIIAIGGNVFLQQTGLLGASQNPSVSDLNTEIADLRTQIDAGLAKVERTAGEATRKAVAEVRSELEAAIADGTTDIAALKDSVAQMQTALEAGEGGDTAALQALRTRLDDLEQKLSNMTDVPGGDGASEALAAMQKQVDGLGGSVAALQEAVSKLSAGADENAASFDRIDNEIANLSARLDQQGSNPEVARAIAAAALKSAIDRGLPFMSELETYASVAPGSPEIDALRNLAARGVPTRSDIASLMGETANAMVAAANASGEDAGFWAQLVASAQSLIKVRPIGMIEGDTPDAIVARMEVAVNANDYSAALAEFNTLPDAAKAAGQALADKILARSQVDDLIDKALAAALKPADQ